MMLLFQVVIFSLCSVGIYAIFEPEPGVPDIDTPAVNVGFESLPGPTEGSISGTITIEPGVKGNAARFPEDSYVQIGSLSQDCPFQLYACAAVSYSLWIKFADFSPRVILCAGAGDLVFHIDNDDTVCLNLKFGFDSYVCKPISEFKVGVWHSITMVANLYGSSLTLAVDGKPTLRYFGGQRRRKRELAPSGLFIGACATSEEYGPPRKKRQTTTPGEFVMDEFLAWDGVIDPLDSYFAAVSFHCFNDDDCDTTNGDYCEEYRCRPGGVLCEVDKDCWDSQHCESSFCVDKTYRCKNDDDCEDDEHCHNPYCYPNYLHCEVDTHCNTSIPEHCVNNVCYPLGTPCFSDNQCPKEEYCADTICVQPADRCRDNNDCGLDKHCHDGRCYFDAMHCHDPNDCKDGTHCYQGICYTNSERCQVNEDCSYYHHCHNGRCYPNYYHCEEDIQCPAGDHCHDGVCHPKTLHCENHDECDTDHHCSEGFCIADADQCLDGHPCPAGQHCHDTICYLNERHCHNNDDCGPLHHCHEPICYLNRMHCHYDTECTEKGELCIHGICREPIDPDDFVEEEPKGLNSRTLAVVVALSVTAGVSLLSAMVAVAWCLWKRCPVGCLYGKTSQVGTFPAAPTPGLHLNKLFSMNQWF